jgi:predicted alpha/beta-fold hydrolase
VGDDADIYGVGFSLGANHLLRYLGANETSANHEIKAAISISNPFDVMATMIGLRYRFFGIYDKSIK